MQAFIPSSSTLLLSTPMSFSKVPSVTTATSTSDPFTSTFHDGALFVFVCTAKHGDIQHHHRTHRAQHVCASDAYTIVWETVSYVRFCLYILAPFLACKREGHASALAHSSVNTSSDDNSGTLISDDTPSQRAMDNVQGISCTPSYYTASVIKPQCLKLSILTRPKSILWTLLIPLYLIT